MALSRFDERGRRSIRKFIAVDSWFTGAGALLLVATRLFFVDSNLLWLLLPFLALLLVCLFLADRILVAAGPEYLALVLIVVGNWAIALAVAAIVPFLWPPMTLTVLIPVVLAAPYVERSSLVLGILGTALVTGAVVSVGMQRTGSGVLGDIDHSLEVSAVVVVFIALVVPIGTIVWQNNQLQHESLVEVTSLNSRLVRTQADLATSRRRVVEAGDVERQRIERDLHDGAQQRLLALGVRLRLLEAKSQDQPELHRALEDLIGELDAAIEEIRELAHGIYPPMLESWGLVEALTAVATRSQLPVRTALGPIGRLDRSIETAMYFTALEALTNATKHAPNADVELTLTRDNDTVILSVVDDGPGFVAEDAQGGGPSGKLGDRIAAVGGALTLVSEIGAGTIVTAVVPVSPSSED